MIGKVQNLTRIQNCRGAGFTHYLENLLTIHPHPYFRSKCSDLKKGFYAFFLYHRRPAPEDTSFSSPVDEER